MKTLARDFEAVAELFQFIFVFTEPFIFHAMRLIRTYVHVKILCLCNSTIFIQRGMSKCTSISYGRDFFLEIIIAPVHTCELYMNNRRYTPGCKKIFKCWHLFDSRTMSFISQSLQSNLRLIKNCSCQLDEWEHHCFLIRYGNYSHENLFLTEIDLSILWITFPSIPTPSAEGNICWHGAQNMSAVPRSDWQHCHSDRWRRGAWHCHTPICLFLL